MGEEAIPMARLLTAALPLHIFGDFSRSAMEEWVVAVLPSLGYRLMKPDESRRMFGTSSTLIVKVHE